MFKKAELIHRLRFAYLLAQACLCSLSASAADCSLKSPEYAVFDLVVKSTDEKVGTAFVIDADLGLFATAYHVLAVESGTDESMKLILRRGNITAEFERVASGNNVVILHEDWAILKAKLKDPSLGLHPTPAMHVAYDRPSAAALTASNVFVTSGSVRQVIGAEWSVIDDPVKACDATNVVMLEIPSYDRGYSGSPVFGEQQCGILGIASRFILPKDAASPGLKEAVRAFQQYTKRVDAARSAKLNNPSGTLNDNFELIREIIKDKIFVKIVPSRCIIDGILIESYRNEYSTFGKILRKDYSDDIKRLVQAFRILDLDDVEASTLTIDMLRNAPMKWIELLQVTQAFRQISDERGFASKNWNSLLQSAFVEKQSILNYRFVDQGYKRAASLVGSDVVSVRNHATLEETINSVLARNLGTGSIKKIQIDADVRAGSEIAPEKRVDLGIKLAELALKPSLPVSARRFAQQASVGYLASGLADESQKITSAKRGEALARMAQALDPSTFVTVRSSEDMKSWVERFNRAVAVSDLQKRVGNAALAEESLSIHDRSLANSAIIEAESFAKDKLQFLNAPNSGFAAEKDIFSNHFMPNYRIF
jgi:hypothetical protein